MASLLESFWHFALPSNSIAICLIASGIAFWLGRVRLGRVLFLLGGLSLSTIVLFPVSALLFEPLESRFAANQLPDEIDGIVVLGGAVNPWITGNWGQPTLTEGAERMTEGVALAKRYPQAKFLFTGGHWGSNRGQLSEADVARAFFEQQGLSEPQAIFEDRATSTYQNAVYSYGLVEPKENEVWILVTSAAHMPRAVGAFRRVGWNVTPYPVDFRTTGATDVSWPPEVGRAISDFDYVVREWMAIVAYWLLGQSDELMPGPEAP